MDITARPASGQRTGPLEHCASEQCLSGLQPQAYGYLRRTSDLRRLTAGLPKVAPQAPAARPRKMAASPPTALKRRAAAGGFRGLRSRRRKGAASWLPRTAGLCGGLSFFPGLNCKSPPFRPRIKDHSSPLRATQKGSPASGGVGLTRGRHPNTTDPQVTSPLPWRSNAVVPEPRSHRNRKWSTSGLAPCCPAPSANAEAPGLAEGTGLLPGSALAPERVNATESPGRGV